ncbi:MAG: TIGR01777 family oxidoreductase [Candidatus Aminicenantales bacterium]
MKIFITGGTGFIGSALTESLSQREHQITILTRSIKHRRVPTERVLFLEGDPTLPGSWQEHAAENDAVINLAGFSIFRRWGRKTKEAILQSRIRTTQNLVSGICKTKRKDTSLISASAVGYYGFGGDQILDESSPPGNDFLASVVRAWEEEAEKARDFGVRVVLCRFGIILGRRGGVFPLMRRAFDSYAGSQFGKGKQWLSWIHEQDLINILTFLLEREDIEGPINCTSPHPVRSKELTQTLKVALAKPTLIPRVPGFMLRLLLGEFSQILLQGQRIIPRRLLVLNFPYQYPHIKDALNDLLKP